MEEAIVVNGFLWLRVFLVGGIFLFFPRITRKGLLFGVYVGEEEHRREAAKRVLRGWDRGCLMLMASALLVGLAFTVAGHAVAGNLTGTAVLLVGVTVLYLRSYSRARGLAKPETVRQAGRATAQIQAGRPRGETFAKVTLGVCLVAGLATVIYSTLSYPSMSARMPTLWSLVGGADGWTEKSLLYVLYVPSWNLVLSPVYALLALMTATAKKSLRDGPGGRSAEAQDSFRATNVYVFSGIALFICAILTLVSVQVVGIGLTEAEALGASVWVTMCGMIVFALVSLAIIIMRIGQGGALIEGERPGGALTGGLADNTHWVLGMFYVNKEDPSLMVEDRFGIGYTLNYATHVAWWFTLGFLFLIILLIAVGIFLL